MVREARATLWVFRLTPGEDCEGTPLDSAAAPLVARAEPWPAPTQNPQESTVGTRAAVAAEAARPEAPALSAALAARPALAETARPVPAPVAAVPAGPSPAPARVPGTAQALPAVSPAEAQPPARAAEAKRAETRAAEATPAAAERAPAKPIETKPTEVKPAETRAAAAAPAAAERAAAQATEVKPTEVKPTEVKPVEARPAETRPEPEVAAASPARPDRAAPAAAQPEPAQRQAAVDVKEERLVIVFPTNSSYFPPGTGSQLRSLLRTLAQERRYEVILESSVSGSQRVVGAETAEEAAKYNKWLAERRLERVRDWLDQNAAGRGLVVKPEYHANDESRQVVVRIRPTG
jgi:hypothetical protein